MEASGSSADRSSLWEKPVPSGGGAVFVKGDGSWRTYQLDADGKTVASEKYDPDGKTWSQLRYAYDAQGRLTSSAGSGEGGGSNTAYRMETTYRYHDDGSFDAEMERDGQLSMERAYDPAGELIETKEYIASDDGSYRRTVYERDDQERVTAQWHYDRWHGDDEELSWTNSRTYEYGSDDTGDFETVCYYDESGGPDYRATTWTDAQGAVTRNEAWRLKDGEWTIASASTSSRSEEVVYGSSAETPSRKTVTITSTDPTLSSTTTTDYDEQGRAVSCTVERGEGPTSVRAAEYRGNVVAGYLDDELHAADLP